MGHDTDIHIIVRTRDYLIAEENWEVLSRLYAECSEHVGSDDTRTREMVVEFPAWRNSRKYDDDEIIDMGSLDYYSSFLMNDEDASENGIRALKELLASPSREEFAKRLVVFAGFCREDVRANVQRGELTCFFRMRVFGSYTKNLPLRQFKRLNCYDGRMSLLSVQRYIQTAVETFGKVGICEEDLMMDTILYDSF